MAVFYPTLDKIREFKVQPTDGEWALLNFLYSNLDDTFEVYFNPYLNGDRLDVIIMRKGYGVLIIEVKDWNIDNFDINEKNNGYIYPMVQLLSRQLVRCSNIRRIYTICI